MSSCGGDDGGGCEGGDHNGGDREERREEVVVEIMVVGRDQCDDGIGSGLESDPKVALFCVCASVYISLRMNVSTHYTGTT